VSNKVASHKATTIRTLTRRPQLVCGSPVIIADEIKYLDNGFNKNNYSWDFIRHSTCRNSEPNATNTNSTPVTTASIPYIKGTSETTTRILQPCNICVGHKLITALRQRLTNVKDKDEPRDRQGTVYKIKCCDYPVTHIGETGRNVNIRMAEHKRATSNGDTNNHIAQHHLQTNHRINWNCAKCSTNYYRRITLESWFTNTAEPYYFHRTNDLLTTTTRQTNNRQTD